MRDVAIIGAGMTDFGKFLDRGMKDLAREAVQGALDSAGIDKSKLETAVVGNATAGLITGQEMIRGQVALRDMGIGGIPIINTENACASSSTAFHVAWTYVASGMYDVALAVGMEKLYHEDKTRSFKAIGSAVDIEWLQQMQEAAAAAKEAKAKDQDNPSVAEGAGEKRSMFMDFYAAFARSHMERYGTTKEQFARIAVKNHYHGSLNPHAQYREVYTLEDILTAPPVAEPLTRLMCSPIGDGAAATVLVSPEIARQMTTKPVWVKASVLNSGFDRKPGEDDVTTVTAKKAYEQAGVGPEDLNVLEVHDASAPAELVLYEELGLCAEGEGGALIDSKATYFDGPKAVNPSGGLISKGHPIGATGMAQIYEIFSQLRGEAGDRQVKNAKLGLTENGGGMVKGDPAAVSVHIFAV
ncbi:MAG: thiolase family protein [Chloroflexi bacterium]|nr:thiolase family protein [Chloroflexota bacterium]MCI0819411.1 thiolase family protein [Chloroflexota bacterium]MCI0831416.1 thiolase family protein [Chloroflexota bacterium]MCI0838129.1 thiolase family protein [Chloroflexota bacterium]MCI0843376.1 thiolase family protein [Chloroflexota bacterium]